MGKKIFSPYTQMKEQAGLDPAWLELWRLYPEQHRCLPGLELRLGYIFARRAYLYEALTHRSAVMVAPVGLGARAAYARLPWNERIEFLGDAVLGLLISTLLWHKGERYSEGELSRLRSSLVNESRLAETARTIDLGSVIILGKGEEKCGGRGRPALLADALEAVIGAVYLDGGFEAAREVVARLFAPYLKTPLAGGSGDYKTLLQEWAQEHYQEAPEYRLIGEVGPDHAKEFEMSVHLAGKTLASGKGASKKRASQEAAARALAGLEETGGLASGRAHKARADEVMHNEASVFIHVDDR